MRDAQESRGLGGVYKRRPLSEDGSTAALFDTAELRWAAGWHGDFVELRGIVYDGPHGTWPRIAGDPAWVNPTGPGVTTVFDAPAAVSYTLLTLPPNREV